MSFPTPPSSPRGAARIARSRAGSVVAALVAGLALAAACTPASSPEARRDPAWLADATRACVLRASCAHGHAGEGARDPGRCVAAWLADLGSSPAHAPSAAQTCATRASTCAAVHACEGEGDAPAVAYCRAHPGEGSACVGDALIDCGDDADEAERVDCRALGGKCQAIKHSGGLTESACVSSTLCPPGAKEGRCEGVAAVISCVDGAAERIPCRAGTRCVARTDADGLERASCEAEGSPRCSAPGARYCEGDRLVACTGPRGTEKSAVSVVDCGALGLRCDGSATTAGCYVLGKNDCAADEPPRCDGATLTFCALGRRVRVACAGGCATAPALSCTPPR
ncbi:MAG: hypothetical protein IPQ09_14440 [Myxococcales bacterium]|nr:hypothetical protein [Myxococcales bacterium]